MAEVREGRIPFHGYETWYRLVSPANDAVPLLCLHGGPGSSHTGLTPLEALADERAVVLYDQLGSKNSSQPSDPSLWTVELFVDEVGAVRDALGLERVHVLGHSWGGMLALEYALTRPPGLASLVLSSTLSSARLWAEEAARLLADLPAEVRDALERHETAGTTGDPEYEQASLEFYKRHLCRLDPWPEAVQELHRTTNLEVYNQMWGPSEMAPTGTLAGWDVTDRLGEIDAPTLVMCGRYDEATPLQAQVIAERILGSELVVFEHSAHLAPFEETERYVGIVRDFLRRVEAP